MTGRFGKIGTVGRVSVAVALCGSLLAEHAIEASLPPRLLPIPLVSQAHPWSCGAAALMAALLYFGVYDDPESVLDAELGVTSKDGTRVDNIVAEARRFGLEAAPRVGLTLGDLEQGVSRGDVVIVALQAWASGAVKDWRTNWEDGHYVVVVGLSRDRVYLMDPSVRTGYGYLTRDQFLQRWHDYDRQGGQRITYQQLGIVIRGGARLARYPADPTPIE
ncbi:MAG TPA: cysteine peptidase family C39 domain-containing protein [Polyangia bacterium]|jgi:predicted double-glycine peptidase|nr:cysteine peptidase family C39 domain-containing protein [Polyangia bacterium]